MVNLYLNLNDEVCLLLKLIIETVECISFQFKYRVGQVVVHLGWVDINFGHYQPHSAWAAGSLAEWAVELGRMMEDD